MISDKVYTIEEYDHYYKQTYTLGICDSLSNVESMIEEYYGDYITSYDLKLGYKGVVFIRDIKSRDNTDEYRDYTLTVLEFNINKL